MVKYASDTWHLCQSADFQNVFVSNFKENQMIVRLANSHLSNSTFSRQNYTWLTSLGTYWYLMALKKPFQRICNCISLLSGILFMEIFLKISWYDKNIVNMQIIPMVVFFMCKPYLNFSMPLLNNWKLHWKEEEKEFFKILMWNYYM